MGTHPIFESDFDCLTEKQMRVSMRVKGVKRGLPFAHETTNEPIKTRLTNRAEQRQLRSKTTGFDKVVKETGQKHSSITRTGKLKVKALSRRPSWPKLTKKSNIEKPIVERTEIKKEPTALNEIRTDEEAYLPVSLEDSITHIEKLIALQSDNKVDRTLTEKPPPSRRLQSPKSAH